MEHVAIILWLALASCQGTTCGPASWEPTAMYPDADLCEAVAERAEGDAWCLPRGWLPPYAPDGDGFLRAWQART